MRRYAAIILAAGGAALAAGGITPFSSSAPGANLPEGWRPLAIKSTKPSELQLVRDEGATVLRVSSNASTGAAGYSIPGDDRRRAILSWRWKIDRVVEGADLARKDGDDYAARVYVFFDIPEEELALTESMKLGLARLIYGPDVPAAAICYVWDNRNPVGTSAWNAYTDRVRMVVLESGGARAGKWVVEIRDVAADYRAAFGSEKVPPLKGIAAGNDTDQTGESATAWFGDFALRERGAVR